MRIINDQVVIALNNDKELKFNFADIIFLERWWNDASEDLRNMMRNLVKEGRIQFVGGHWVMPDEATV